MIQKRQRRDRSGKAYHVYKVRWEVAGHERSKTLPRGTTKQEAEDFERRVMTLKRTGELPSLDRGRETLADFAGEWWELYAGRNLARSSLLAYASAWNTHINPRIGGLTLRELTPEAITRFRQDLERSGVGAPTIHRSLALLQGMLSRAVEWQRIAHNPVAAVRKPVVKREREVVVIPPETVEAIRARLEALDATLISVLAYAGLRPWSEAVGLTWDDLGERTLRVYAPKTRRSRSVALLGPLRTDLAAFRLASGRPPGKAPIFGTWGPHAPRAWHRRVWRPVLEAVGLPPSTTPYTLRHSFASLLIAEGGTVIEVAQQLGHAPTMTLETYAHVFAEFEPGARVPAEERIRAARAKGGERAL